MMGSRRKGGWGVEMIFLFLFLNLSPPFLFAEREEKGVRLGICRR